MLPDYELDHVEAGKEPARQKYSDVLRLMKSENSLCSRIRNTRLILWRKGPAWLVIGYMSIL
jgi:hypothetical protein